PTHGARAPALSRLCLHAPAGGPGAPPPPPRHPPAPPAPRRWQGEPRLGPGDFARVPAAVAVFPHTLIPEGQPPREWAERLYQVRHWTVMPSGGHFAPAEEPELLARDIAAFFATMDR